MQSEPRDIRERQLAAADMDAAEFGAPVQGRKYLAGIEQAFLVEGAFEPLLRIQIGLVEHDRHQVALFDADAMFTGEPAADSNAQFQYLGPARRRHPQL